MPSDEQKQYQDEYQRLMAADEHCLNYLPVYLANADDRKRVRRLLLKNKAWLEVKSIRLHLGYQKYLVTA